MDIYQVPLGNDQRLVDIGLRQVGIDRDLVDIYRCQEGICQKGSVLGPLQVGICQTGSGLIRRWEGIYRRNGRRYCSDICRLDTDPVDDRGRTDRRRRTGHHPDSGHDLRLADICLGRRHYYHLFEKYILKKIFW